VELLLATQNKKKLVELEALLAPLGIRVMTPDQVGGIPDTIEDGDTFEANAGKKASEAARATGKWALADDSGLVVAALDGEPGVHSARFAGVHGDDAANNRLLLERLSGVEDDARAAYFVCVLSLARPDGSIDAEFRGEAHGRILHEPRGDRDFGYDPLFLFTEPGFDVTGRGFAELTLDEKSLVSHRGRALTAARAHLSDLVASGTLRS